MRNTLRISERLKKRVEELRALQNEFRERSETENACEIAQELGVSNRDFATMIFSEPVEFEEIHAFQEIHSILKTLGRSTDWLLGEEVRPTQTANTRKAGL